MIKKNIFPNFYHSTNDVIFKYPTKLTTFLITFYLYLSLKWVEKLTKCSKKFWIIRKPWRGSEIVFFLWWPQKLITNFRVLKILKDINLKILKYEKNSWN